MGSVAIVGAQWGSEGKGVVAHALAGHFQAGVRTGGPNAGHSFVHEGRVHKMRGIPCIWVNPEAVPYIGAGAVVDMDLLDRELQDLPKWVTVLVDQNAAVVTHDDAELESAARLWEQIGSTTEGVGQARMRKMSRLIGKLTLVRDWPGPLDMRLRVVEDVADMLWHHDKAGDLIMLEGTQGSGLSLHHGTRWPFATSTDTNASQLAADAGLPPSSVEHTFLVARTLPIRVAGNSGPMGEELDWADLAQYIPGLEPEKTTVTKRIRRISRWEPQVFKKAVRLNSPCGVFLMFADYLVPEVTGMTDGGAVLDVARQASTPLGDLLALTAGIEDGYRVPIIAYGTGGPEWSLAWRGRCAHGTSWSPAP